MKKARRYGQWTVGRRLGGGGNGDVFEAMSHQQDGQYAIKILRRATTERLARFRDEVEFLKNNPSRSGILSLVDSDLSPGSGEVLWYVMPKATPIQKALGDDPEPLAVAGAVTSIAETLAALAADGIAHRDIKPDNLFQLADQWVIGDFGLVKYPDKDPVTKHGRKVGPVDYMAPEMRRDADIADAEPADVWALAKTLWVLLLSVDEPLPGPHRPDDEAFSLQKRMTFNRAAELDLLLRRATSIDPSRRVSMAEFGRELRACLGPPVEAITAPTTADLERRITLLTTSTFEQSEAVMEWRRKANGEFERLKDGLSEAYHALAFKLPHFRSQFGSNIGALQTSQCLDFNPFAFYRWGGRFTFTQNDDAAVIVELAVGMAVQKYDGLAQIEGVLRVDEGLNDVRNDRYSWQGCGEAAIGSALLANEIAEIRNGFFDCFPAALQTVAQMLGGVS